MNDADPLSERALVLTPTGRDAGVAGKLLGEAGLPAETMQDLAHLVAELDRGAGLLVIADEALHSADLKPLLAWLDAQPPWSDVPLVILTRQSGAERNPATARLADLLGNVSYIERPFHPTTFASVVRTAMRSRRRQYDSRSLLESLRRSEERLQTALNAGRFGSWTLDVRARSLECSETSLKHFGGSAEDKFEYDDLIAAIVPEDRQRHREAVIETLRSGNDYLIEHRVTWPDDSLHWVEIRGRVQRDQHGKATHLIGVSNDITDRKVAELEREQLVLDLARERSALSDLTQTLEQRVAERTAELMREVAEREKTQEQLRQAQKMESLGQLTGGVAHDFNNLLMAIMGNMELLRKRAPDDPRLHRLIDGALQGAKRGATLTQRLLAFARQQDLRPVSTDIASLIDEMTDLLERSLGPQIRMHLSIPDHLPPALLDPNQFELAVLNLAINARDAMPEGGAIHITVECHDGADHPALRAGSYLRVQVADSGTGMDAQTLAKATEPFFSTKPVGKGTGLGLSMVRGLTEQLGGRFEIESEVGQGTAVDLWIPAAPDAPAAAIEAAHVPAPEQPSTILLVDDDALIAMSAVNMLEDLGHKVIEANSGQDALNILRSNPEIDLLVTDLSMPGMTGLELAKATLQVRPGMPILLVTGFADVAQDDTIKLPRLGKPYHQNQLQAEIARLLPAGGAGDAVG